MKTILNFSNKCELELPPQFCDDDNRFSESFVRYFLNEYTKEDDVVFDPFVGYGTTLRVAESVNRIGYGTEYNEDKVAFVKTTLENPNNIILGDALKLPEYDLPNFDFSITSPIYMNKTDENPFRTERTEKTDYDQYLADIKSVYTHINQKLKPGGRAIIEVSNLKKKNGIITTLAWDIAKVISEVLTFEGEIVINWEEGYQYGYDHSYALVFKKR